MSALFAIFVFEEDHFLKEAIEHESFFSPDSTWGNFTIRTVPLSCDPVPFPLLISYRFRKEHFPEWNWQKHITVVSSMDMEEQDFRLETNHHAAIIHVRDIDELPMAVKKLHFGYIYLSTRVHNNIFDKLLNFEHIKSNATRGYNNQLTPLERKIVLLSVKLKSNQDIASNMGIKVKTVENHKNIIGDKLDLKGRGEIARWALQRYLHNLEMLL